MTYLSRNDISAIGFVNTDAIEKAIQRRHINQPTTLSDHFSLPGHSNQQYRTHSPRTNKIEQRRYSESKRSVINFQVFQGQDP